MFEICKDEIHRGSRMTENEIDKYLRVVDIVCLDCAYGNEDTCEKCPVRLTVENINTKGANK